MLTSSRPPTSSILMAPSPSTGWYGIWRNGEGEVRCLRENSPDYLISCKVGRYLSLISAAPSIGRKTEVTDCLPCLNLLILTPSRGRYILRKRFLPSMNIIGLSAAFVARVLACLEKEPSLPYGPSLPFPSITLPYLTLWPLPDHAPLLLNTPGLHPAFLIDSRLPSHCFLFIQQGPPFIQLVPSKYPFGCLPRSACIASSSRSQNLARPPLLVILQETR